MLNPSLKRDVRRGLFRTGAFQLLLAPFWIYELVEGRGGVVDWVVIASLITTLGGVLVCVSLVEGRVRRSAGGRRVRALAVLWILALGGALVPLLILQATYVEPALSGDASRGISEVQRQLASWARVPGEFLVKALVFGLPWVVLSLPRMRGDTYPSADAVKLALLCSLPLLVISPCTYPFPAIAVGFLSMLYTLGDWTEARLFRGRHQGAGGALRERLHSGEIRHKDLRLAAALGDPAALSARGLRAPETLGPRDLVAALLRSDRDALVRAVVILTQGTLPSHPEPTRARAALGLVARQILRPSAAHRAAVEEIRPEWVWGDPPTPPATRALHDAIECVLESGDSKSSAGLGKSLESVLGEALLVSSPDAIVVSLREELLGWCLHQQDPLESIAAPLLEEEPADEGDGPVGYTYQAGFVSGWFSQQGSSGKRLRANPLDD